MKITWFAPSVKAFTASLCARMADLLVVHNAVAAVARSGFNHPEERQTPILVEVASRLPHALVVANTVEASAEELALVLSPDFVAFLKDTELFFHTALFPSTRGLMRAAAQCPTFTALRTSAATARGRGATRTRPCRRARAGPTTQPRWPACCSAWLTSTRPSGSSPSAPTRSRTTPSAPS